MGTLDDLLVCFDEDELESICYRNTGPEEGPFPTRKRDLVALIRKYLAEDHLSFRQDVLSRARLKDDLLALSEAAGVDDTGTMEDLRRRLCAWYERVGVDAQSAPAVGGAHAMPVRADIADLPFGDRQFLRITEPKESTDPFGALLGGLGRVLSGSASETKARPVDLSEVSRLVFEPGHPRRGEFYVGDPFAPLRYLSAAVAAQEIAAGKMAALAAIAGCLGARRVEVIDVKTESSRATHAADVQLLGKSLGLGHAVSAYSASNGRLCIEWTESRVVPIPQEYLRYLDAPGLQDLKMVAALVQSNRIPSDLTKEISLDFRDCQQIALKVSQLPGIGGGGLAQRTQQLLATEWRFQISWNGPPANEVRTRSPNVLSPPSVAPLGPPCPSCHSALAWIAQYQRWYCQHCAKYV